MRRLLTPLSISFKELENSGKKELISQNLNEKLFVYFDRVYLRYKDSDSSLAVRFDDYKSMKSSFENTHKARFGFISPEKTLIIESIQVEVSCQSEQFDLEEIPIQALKTKTLTSNDVFIGGETQQTIFYNRSDIASNDLIFGPAVIIESTSTIVIEPGWQGCLNDKNDLILERTEKNKKGECDWY